MPPLNQKIPKRVLSSLLASISAGVVPRMGAPYITIGRSEEIEALLSDLEAVNDGGGSMRFIIGKYGSGKSFLIQLLRGFSLERGFITADADLSPERRLCGAKGTGIATYRELIKNLASKSSPDGGALPQIIAKWLSELQSTVAAEGFEIGTEEFTRKLTAKIYAQTRQLESQIGGFDFATIITTYYKAYLNGDEEKKSACIRWLRGEYSTKTEARNSIGVMLGSIIDDDNWYEYIKLFAVFFRGIGYRGFVVFIDECVNLYKIANRISRENNYEKILSMFNDTLQGKAEGLAIILGGTPQFLEDTRRGLFSYEALRSRLSDGQFQKQGYKNFIGPVIRLRRLSDDELLALVARITVLHAQNYNWQPRVTNEDMADFLKICLERAGADTMITPREIIRDYITVLNILLQNAATTFGEVIGSGVVTLKHGEDEDEKLIVDADAPDSNGNVRPKVISASDFSAEDIEL
jgi:hypothetical protein